MDEGVVSGTIQDGVRSESCLFGAFVTCSGFLRVFPSEPVTRYSAFRRNLGRPRLTRGVRQNGISNLVVLTAVPCKKLSSAVLTLSRFVFLVCIHYEGFTLVYGFGDWVALCLFHYGMEGMEQHMGCGPSNSQQQGFCFLPFFSTLA